MDKEIEKALKELEEELKWTHNDGVNLTKYDESLFNVIKLALMTKSEKEKAFDVIKKYAVNDGWSNGWVIKFWDMDNEELELVNEVLK